jgi:threonine dehydratase
MTSLLEQQPLVTTPELFETADDVAQAVGKLLDRLDVDTHLQEQFYGESGVQPTGLIAANRPVIHPNRPAENIAVYFKDETTHSVDMPDGDTEGVTAFKRRGALLAAILAHEANPGLERLVTASAGNHGQGVAAAAVQLGLEATVFVKTDIFETNPRKVEKITKLGAEVVAAYDSLAEAMDAADMRAAMSSGTTTYVPPYDSVEVMAGQSTIGLEMLADLQIMEAEDRIDLQKDNIAVVLPVGGGGLAAGVAIAFKRARDNGTIGPNVQVIASYIEDKDNNGWSDGTATSTGQLTGLILDDPAYVQEHRTVSSVEVADAMHDLAGRFYKPIEPAGAVAHAALRQLAREHVTSNVQTRMTFVVPVTGATIDSDTYKQKVEIRNLPNAKNLRYLGDLVVERPDRPFDPAKHWQPTPHYYGRYPAAK